MRLAVVNRVLGPGTSLSTRLPVRVDFSQTVTVTLSSRCSISTPGSELVLGGTAKVKKKID